MLGKRHREDFPSKVTEEIAKSCDLETNGLSPYHCKLNPMELVWGTLKNYVATENADLKVEQLRNYLEIKETNFRKIFGRTVSSM